MNILYTEYVSCRLEPQMAAKVTQYAQQEKRKRSDFVRQLLTWALKQYEQAGSLHTLLRQQQSLEEE